MLLTKECDYGIRIIRALSCGNKKTIDTISDTEHIPSKFAYKIIKKLVKSDMVRSARGRIGGYILNKPLNEFTLLDIVTAIDNERYIKDCLKPGFVCNFKDSTDKHCTVHSELTQVQSVIISALGAKTMEEILQTSTQA
ncbi:MAG: Rrf2 family transcriptional regulator [Defluviitaleaceae bacterium]|nr:Rrf2 family transcriptional regulator [Defluviitaleaceae bacterium]